jgi:hypothetical protein
LLSNNVHQAIHKKGPEKQVGKKYLYDASPRMENLMKVTLATMSWEIMNHPLQSPELAPGDFNLFGPMRVHLGG